MTMTVKVTATRRYREAWRYASECAMVAAVRKNALKLDPDQVAGVARKKAQAWVARRPWLTERERAHAFLEFADCFYQITLDFIAAQAREAGDEERARWALHLENLVPVTNLLNLDH